MNRKKRNVGHNSHGLYFHSSAPKVYPHNEDFGKIHFEFTKNIASKANALVIKPSNIRIWIHDKDIDKLMKVVLEGHGQKLRREVASNIKVKRFLEYVPHFMGLIKSIHTAVVENNIELLRTKTSPPVPPQMLSCKDTNGLTPLHKAAGLAHTKIVEYLLETWSNAVQDVDNSGKTPLHYAASVRNNERTFNLLVQAGADESAIDGKGRTPAFYKKAKNSEDIDRGLLTVIPDAPRIAEQGFPSHFSWDNLPAKFYQPPLKFSQSEINLSNNHTENVMKQSSSAFEILSTTDSNMNNGDDIEEDVQKANFTTNERPKTFNKKDLNNNSAKSNGTDEMNDDDDDVHTVETAETETLLPEDKIGMNGMENGMNGDADDEEDNPEGPDDSDIKSEGNNEVDTNDSNEFVEINETDADPDVDGSDPNENLEQENENYEVEVPEDEDVQAEAEENENLETENENLEEGPVENGPSELEDTQNDEQEPEASENQEVEKDPSENGEENQEIEKEASENEEEPEQNEEESPENVDTLIETEQQEEVESVTSDNDEQTIVNNDNNDSAYETNGIESHSRIQSSDTNNNDNNETESGENFENLQDDNPNDDNNVDILIINNQENIPEEEEDDEQHNDGNDESLNDKEIENIESHDDDDDVMISADNTRETGDSTNVNDTNEDQMDEDDEDIDENDIGSPSPPFEGIVHEEPEKQNESQGREFEKARDEENGEINEPYKEEDNIQKIINSGDMEQLAILVLNGDGNKLVGKTTTQPDIQAFLDNVPIYMGKIHKVHAAAREGSLRDLQAALDRRKFSTAKDEISPNGTTPLHVAIIFGHTAIIRYLGSRFPETLAATDDENRTALHYAATIKDNGHFYNLLVTLGANPKAVDNYGNSAEFYLNHDESDKILSHKELLKSFGAAEELADEMLNDQEYKSNAPVEIPLFRTEEGRYLATSLGDPLIKGLTEVANLRPSDPIGFLANYLQTFAVDGRQKTSTANKKSEKIETKPEPPKPQIKTAVIQNHVKPLSSKTITVMPVKEKSVENLIDDHAEDYDVTPGMDERDEHGQSMLHFAAARQHGKNALFQLIEESGVSLTYRDEIYRTARDVSLQASQPENCKEIDRYVLSMAARGDYETFVAMVLDGYDHIVDVTDNDGASIAQVAKARNHHELATYLDQIRDFEENRERLLFAIRHDDLETVKETLQYNDGAKLARAKNYYGRCSLHVAVLVENEEIVEYIASNFRQTLKVGDNLERTALHYSMGINNVEAISRILIKNGAKRVMKDLKGRTASFYYINKGDIARLQEEEKL
ncbi:uncharacterized protein [Chironomus tepperi]|uniref:uncharacterized protein isoform X1 n=1 Tax=Chironomus tepperi TaxID=113505 RepID=UPI00391F0099